MIKPNHFGKSSALKTLKLESDNPTVFNMSLKNSATVLDKAIKTIRFNRKKLKNM